MAVCSSCTVAPAIAQGLCRRCYDAAPGRRARRREAQQGRVWWRQEGLAVDPLDGWQGAHGVAVRASSGVCVLRRPDRMSPAGWWQVRRPGHPLASRDGWVAEPVMWLFDQWQALGRPRVGCAWCRRRLVFPVGRRPVGAVLVQAGQQPTFQPDRWEPASTVAGCWECVTRQRWGVEAVEARRKGGRRAAEG